VTLQCDVRFWPKADIPRCTAAVGGKADMTIALRKVRL
jgi:hypothetical protein